MIDETNASLQSVSIKQHSCTSKEAFKRYSNYIFPTDICEDLIRNQFESLMCNAIYLQEQIIGLAIATPRQDSDIQLISFYIIPTLRGKGLGTQLMLSIIETIKNKGLERLHGNYKTFWSDNKAWEKILRKANWNITNTELQYVVIDELLKLKNAVWASKYQLPKNTHVQSLDPVKCKNLSEWIKQASWTHEIPVDVLPGKALNHTNKECSLLLIINHDIAGWIIVQNLEKGVGQVSALYIRKKYGLQHRDLALRLIAEAFRRNQTLTKAYFGYRKGNKYMERLIQNRFKDYSTHYHKRRCQKTLQ